MRLLNVRLLAAADLPRAREIVGWAITHTWAHFADESDPLDAWTAAWEETRTHYPWLVALVDGDAVAGFARAAPFRTRCAYRWTPEVSVYVDPAHQGRGVGRALYDVLLPLLRAQGYHSALGRIALPNDASERLHAACGFVHAGTVRRAGWKLGAWRDVATWQLPLAAPDAPPGDIRPVAETLG